MVKRAFDAPGQPVPVGFYRIMGHTGFLVEETGTDLFFSEK
jgi:hypothetical protein